MFIIHTMLVIVILLHTQRITHAEPLRTTGYSLLSSIDDLPSGEDDSYSTEYSVGDVSLFSECLKASHGYNTDDDLDSLEQGTSNVDVEEESENDDTLQSPYSQQALLTQVLGPEEQQHEQPVTLEPSVSKDHFGYVLVMDNIDMNVRRSFQRSDRTTNSYHFCHAYALQNRINTSTLSDGPPSGTLSIEAILPSTTDLLKITEDFTVLISRFVSYMHYMHLVGLM